MKSKLFLLFGVINILDGLVHVDFVGDVSLSGAPLEEVVEYFDTVGFLNDPMILELVVLCHLCHMILHVLVDVLAKKIHIRLAEAFLAVLLVYYILQEQHEEQVEGLELGPHYPRAHQVGELYEPVRDADIAIGVTDGHRPRVEVHIHLRKDLDLVQVGLVERLSWHFAQELT